MSKKVCPRGEICGKHASAVTSTTAYRHRTWCASWVLLMTRHLSCWTCVRRVLPGMCCFITKSLYALGEGKRGLLVVREREQRVGVGRTIPRHLRKRWIHGRPRVDVQLDGTADARADAGSIRGGGKRRKPPSRARKVTCAAIARGEHLPVAPAQTKSVSLGVHALVLPEDGWRRSGSGTAR